MVIGEFGARDKEGNLQDRVDYATYYIAAAKSRGITCCWWDNNAFNGEGENFGVEGERPLPSFALYDTLGFPSTDSAEVLEESTKELYSCEVLKR